MADYMQGIELEQDQETGPEQEQEQEYQETGPAKRGRGRPRGSGRGRGRGRGRDAENQGNLGEEDEAPAGGRGRGRGRRGGGGGGGVMKIDYAIRETEPGSNEWRAKCYQAHRETDHVFLNKTAAAVSFDISHIIALQRGFCKTGGRKGGCYLENASKQLLQFVMDVKQVKSYQKNGKDDLHSAVLVISKMLDAFLTTIRSKEDAERAIFVCEWDPKDAHIVQLCFYGNKIYHPRSMNDVPGLKEIVEKHLEVLVQGLPDNPVAALPAVTLIHSDDEQFGGAAENLLPPPEDAPAVLPSGRPRRNAATKLLKASDDQNLAKKVTPEKRKAAEDLTEGVPSSKRQRKKKDKAGDGDGGGGEDGDGAEERVAPYLILEVFTECRTHGKRKSSHFHFAHDCVCEAKTQMRQCLDFINLDPYLRAYLDDFQLPPCFVEWKNRLLRSNV